MRIIKTSHLLASACALIALSGCETVAEEVTEAVGNEYEVTLSPMSGGTGGGKAEVSLNDATNMICTDLELTNGVTMTAGHIMGPGNTVIADIDVPDDNDSDDCDNVGDGVIDAIRQNPSAYSVHIQAGTGDLHGTLRKE
ncbi:MAG TPA: hypothetical protein VGB59_02960 [Allosphingosinicella sp.]|jgi:hypothetical protein